MGVIVFALFRASFHEGYSRAFVQCATLLMADIGLSAEIRTLCSSNRFQNHRHFAFVKRKVRGWPKPTAYAAQR